jgi:hypothetical protein
MANESGSTRLLNVNHLNARAGMAELADAADLKSAWNKRTETHVSASVGKHTSQAQDYWQHDARNGTKMQMQVPPELPPDYRRLRGVTPNAAPGSPYANLSIESWRLEWIAM